MAALFIFAAWFLLVRQTFALNNDAPCLPSPWISGHDTFVRRHIRSDTPNSLDQNEWENYIKHKNDCDRPTQSFLQQKDLGKVIAVCTAKGGVIYKENLCLSRQPFTFVTVRIDTTTCSIRSVREETKHLILACDRLINQCLPVHFERNPRNLKPNNNDRPCQAEVTTTTTTTTTATSNSRRQLKPGGSGGRANVPQLKDPPRVQVKRCKGLHVLCCTSSRFYHYLLSCHKSLCMCTTSIRSCWSQCIKPYWPPLYMW